MTFLGRVWHIFPGVDRILYSRAVQCHIFFPKDSTTDLFLARIPIDEGLVDMADCEVTVCPNSKSIQIIGKRKNASEIPKTPEGMLEPSAQTAQLLGSHE